MDGYRGLNIEIQKTSTYEIGRALAELAGFKSFDIPFSSDGPALVYRKDRNDGMLEVRLGEPAARVFYLGGDLFRVEYNETIPDSAIGQIEPHLRKQRAA